MDLVKFAFFTTIICPLLVIRQQVRSGKLHSVYPLRILVIYNHLLHIKQLLFIQYNLPLSVLSLFDTSVL